MAKVNNENQSPLNLLSAEMYLKQMMEGSDDSRG